MSMYLSQGCMYLSQGSYMARTRGATCRVESHRLSAPGQNNQGPSWSTHPPSFEPACRLKLYHKSWHGVELNIPLELPFVIQT